jgi:hypothetical protein
MRTSKKIVAILLIFSLFASEAKAFVFPVWAFVGWLVYDCIHAIKHENLRRANIRNSVLIKSLKDQINDRLLETRKDLRKTQIAIEQFLPDCRKLWRAKLPAEEEAYLENKILYKIFLPRF